MLPPEIPNPKLLILRNNQFYILKVCELKDKLLKQRTVNTILLKMNTVCCF